MVHLYSVSGMPSCSFSMSMSLSSAELCERQVSRLRSGGTRTSSGRAALTKVGDPILTGTLEHHGKALALVLCLKGHHVLVACALENLAHVGGVKSQRDGPVASEVVEASVAEGDRDEGDVRGVHGLDGYLIVGAVDVGFLDEVFDGLDDLFEDFALG